MSRLFAALFALTLLIGCAPAEDKPVETAPETAPADTETEPAGDMPAETPEETPAE